MENKRGNTQQSNLERQKGIQSFRENTAVKECIIILAKQLERSCNYESYDNVHQSRELSMEKLQRQWEEVGSAGIEEERLWKSFCAVTDRFWKGILWGTYTYSSFSLVPFRRPMSGS